MKTFLLTIVIFLFCGCTSIDNTKIQKGNVTTTPYGYAELCVRTPNVPECSGDNK